MDIYAPPDFLPFDLVLIYLRDCLMFVLASVPQTCMPSPLIFSARR